jgi:hypothetical protein
MNQSEPLIPNNYIVEERIIKEYIQKKNKFMRARNYKAFLNIVFTLIITGFYYADIGTDLYLCWQYYKDRDIWWFGYTLGIVIFSSLFNTFVLFYYSYFQEFKINLKKKQLGRIVLQSFSLLFQLEMLFR